VTSPGVTAKVIAVIGIPNVIGALIYWLARRKAGEHQ
jgi:hypothetical protein